MQNKVKQLAEYIFKKHKKTFEDLAKYDKKEHFK
jgi:hypothetical protein